MSCVENFLTLAWVEREVNDTIALECAMEAEGEGSMAHDCLADD